AEEIVQRVIPASALQFAGAAARRKSLGVKRYARKQGIRKNKEKQPEAQGNTKSSALRRAQDADYFALPPGCAPEKRQDSDNGAAGAEKDNTSGRAEREARDGESESHEGQGPAALVAEEQVAAESKDEQPSYQEKIAETASAHEYRIGAIHG